MNIKRILMLAFGIMTLPLAATSHTIMVQPTVLLEQVTVVSPRKGTTKQKIKITIKDVQNFKSEDFKIRFSEDGKKATITGKSYRLTKKDMYGKDKKIRNEFGKHVRYVFCITVDLPSAVRPHLRGHSRDFYSKYFGSYKKHSTDDTMVITIPVALPGEAGWYDRVWNMAP